MVNFDEIRKLATEIEASPVDESVDVRPYIENTILRPEATPEEIRAFCEESLKYGFLGVCVNPYYVRLAKEVVGDRMKVVSVVGFPLGASRSDVKAYEARKAVEDGADEIDMVINGGATIYDVLLMARATNLPVKASGGIRTKEFALKLIKAGARRLGTSRGPQVAGLE